MPRRPPPPPPGLPTAEQVLAFIAASPTPVGKREIARAFGLHAQDKIALKSLMRDMTDAGQLDVGPKRQVHKGGGLPKVTVLRVIEAGDGRRSRRPTAGTIPESRPRSASSRASVAARSASATACWRGSRRPAAATPVSR